MRIPLINGRPGSLCRRRRGVTAVEAAIVLGLTLVLILAIFEYGRFVMFRQLLDNATREGARLAVTGTANQTTANIQATVTQYLAGQNFQNVNVQVYQADPSTGNNQGAWTNAAFGEGIAVQVTAQYSPMLPTLGFLPNPVPMTSTVIMLSEAN